MARPNLNKAEFIKSAAAPDQFVQSAMPRIAFAGKSNVGKSSVINRLLNRKNFARVGSEPVSIMKEEMDYSIIAVNQTGICGGENGTEVVYRITAFIYDKQRKPQ